MNRTREQRLQSILSPHSRGDVPWPYWIPMHIEHAALIWLRFFRGIRIGGR